MFKIDLNDNLEFIMDKQAHLYVSFGLYYFFYTYTDDMILSICLTFLTGLKPHSCNHFKDNQFFS